jgi:hypothetical protein
MQKKQRVRVYRNLHNGKLSIKYKNTVVGYCDFITLKNPKYIISASGKKRAIETRIRNVHAFVEGEIAFIAGFCSFKNRQLPEIYEVLYGDPLCSSLVKYNPFVEDGFTFQDGSFPVEKNNYTIIDCDGKISAHVIKETL